MNKKASVNMKRLEERDIKHFVDLIKLFEDVFEMKNFTIPNRKHLQNLLKRENFDVFVALQDNLVIGGLTTYILEQYYSEKPMAYIYDLAVDRNYQRQGIGKKLIEEVKKIYKLNGFEDMFVQAEQVDKEAVEFYRQTNPSEEETVTYFSYSLN